MKHLCLFLALALALAIVSCDSKSVPTKPDPNINMAISLVSANDQSLVAGSYHIDLIQVRVINEDSLPVEGVEVRLLQVTPNDRTNPFNRIDSTDASGLVSMAYRADTLIGADTIRITATGAVDSVAYFSVIVTPDVADTFYLESPTGALASVAGEPIADTLKFKVLDKYNNPVPDYRVLFKSPGRCLVVTDSTALLPVENDSVYTRTDANGMAWAVWHLSVNRLQIVGYPNQFVFRAISQDNDTLSFQGTSSNPGTIDYYNKIRPIFEENCFLCHPTVLTTYSMNTYDSAVTNPIIIPGDTLNSTMLTGGYATGSHQANDINVIETDKIRLWIGYYNAVAGTPPPMISAHGWTAYTKK
ncbi:MAG: hypothetical protein R3F48_04215 [Candidatus Zixiibacteriota bacterium]